MYKSCIKRILDLLIGIAAFPFFLIAFLIFGPIIKVTDKGPIFYNAKRIGKNGKLFKMFKFRTMIDPQTRDGRKLTDKERLECIEKGIDCLTDEERLPKLGRFLRTVSLDELPELWNIFIGDMSIVGPRPLVTIYLRYYTNEEMRRHDVRPGLTGWAQVHGRNSASWKEKFKYDLYYVDNCSFILDVKTIFKTVAVVFNHKDIGQGAEKPVAFNIERQKEWDKVGINGSVR